MIRKSSKLRGLAAAVAQAVPAYQDATDVIDEAAARVLGLNRTDLRCLGILLRGAPASAGTLARATGLTRGAMTTVLDRLERAGYARRTPHPGDRRSVRVEATPAVLVRVEAIWGPIRDEGARLLARYSERQLHTLLRFLEQGRALQEAHAARIRSMAGLAPSGRARGHQRAFAKARTPRQRTARSWRIGDNPRREG
jgi:DNA-binding MarR family transcriptional regulator